MNDKQSGFGRRPWWLALIALAGLCACGLFGQEQPAKAAWLAGAVAVDITPAGPVWMGGFGARTRPSEGVAQRIFTKALAIQDAHGSRVVLVTMDLVKVPRELRASVERTVGEKYGLAPESILLNCSHSHSGPDPAGADVESFFLDHNKPADPQWVRKADDYQKFLADKIVVAVGEALSALQPADLIYTHARAGFAMNRRLRVGDDILDSANPDGPIDHDVPVLRVIAPDGSLKAILFGYACHNTTVQANTYLINGDYAGFTQADLQADHPGTIALFMQGAAGDQNPYPRGSLELASRHGRALADAVEAAIGVKVQHPVHGPLRSALVYAQLGYAEDSRADLERRARDGTPVERVRAQAWIKRLDSGQGLPQSYPCPVQVVRFGRDLTLIAIGGELTSEYSLRLKRELGAGPPAIWVCGYTNDVFGYLGSKQVLIGGGYEGYHLNVSRPIHPGPFALDTEDRVIAGAYEALRDTNTNTK